MSTPEPIRVVIGDDHPLYRQALAEVLDAAPGLSVVAAAADGHAALERILALAPQVAILDVKMPGLTGPEVMQALAAAGPAGVTRVIYLSAHLDGEAVRAGLQSGALGFLTKDAEPGEIRDAVRRVAAGDTVVAARLVPEVAAVVRGEGEERPRLSPREAEILALLAEGASAPEIGRRLAVSTPTVKTHLARLYAKLGVSDRAAAVAEGMRRGLLE